MTSEKDGLAKLREPFPAHQISKLPKPTKAQTDEVRADFRKGIRCKICDQWHHPKVVHLDYVGHAALTDRLLDCDPEWNWEPVAMNDQGMPLRDRHGGMWIRLTVCGVTRLGYGHADGKDGGDAVKEIIGDALRNAAMRFGAALDLWHKGDLHADDGQDDAHDNQPPAFDAAAATHRIMERFEKCETKQQLRAAWAEESDTIRMIKSHDKAAHERLSTVAKQRAEECADDPAMQAPPPADEPGGDDMEAAE